MVITCGKDVFDIDSIKSIGLRGITPAELENIEREKNGEYLSAKDVFSDQLFAQIVTIITENVGLICRHLPEPKLMSNDVEQTSTLEMNAMYDEYLCALGVIQKNDTDTTAIKGWEKFGDDRLSVISTEFDNDGSFEIEWSFSVWRPARGADSMRRTKRIIFFSQILPILKDLIDLPKPRNAWQSFWAGYSYKDIQNNICPVYEEYMACKSLIDLREERKASFVDCYSKTQVLCIKIKGEPEQRKYYEGFCDFDILEKENEIQNALSAYEDHVIKLRKSNNAGENNVDYAIGWIIAASNGSIITIKGDCESKHRYNTIMLYKEEFKDEPQEYDHILVCTAGVVLIETKHWEGMVEIRPDGQWICKENTEAIPRGVDSPKFQMRRHEVLMQNILPGIPVYSLLCFSNASAIINGRENFAAYPIVTIDQLEEAISNICANGTYSEEDIQKIVNTIETHKVHRMKESI